MTSPAAFTPDVESPQSPANNMFGHLQTRPMRVKVLYTFDDENKTNCLARFPEVLAIPTVSIDDTTQIGVIELRKCIQAIVSASPELLSRLGQGDFTIYAYDYSEYETPLVGQGMLSSALAAASPTPAAPAHQSKTMITGRVCQNVMGLFSNGVKETLEVKLRLVPVPRPVQNEYIKSMEMYRGVSPAMSAGFDPNAWSASFQTTALSLGAPFEEAATPTSTVNDAPHPACFDGQSMTHPQHPRHASTASFQGQPSFSAQHQSYSQPPSRVNSPALSQHMSHQQHARSLSRASVRSDRSVQRRESVNDLDQYHGDSSAPKRVKLTQTEWRGKSAFAANPADLRVTASSAASIRIHKPVATRPGLTNANSLEPPPRVPTPVPQLQNNSNINRQGSFLRRESSLARAQSYNSPYSQAVDMPTHSDAALSSPEDNANNSPADFPSSPPMMPEPSSPGLPTITTLPKPIIDSGYMSSTMDCNEDDEDRELDEDDLRMAQRYHPRESRPHVSQPPFSDFVEQTPGPPELLPSRMEVHRNAQDAIAAELSRKKARNAVVPTSERRASLASAPKQNSQDRTNPVQNTGPSRSSSNNTAASEAASPAPLDDGILPKAPRSGSGAKRKKTIQEKLMAAVAQGDMPAYCGNCGSIETPTWRALFTKVIEGSPSDLGPELDGVSMGTEILDRSQETGKITKYRIIKSTRKNKDPLEVKGYTTLQVCNPCGLWFNKYKVMRPSDKWCKKVAKGRKRKTDSDPAGPSEPQSDFFCDQPSMYIDAAQPEEYDHAAPPMRGGSSEVPQAPLPRNHVRANSEQPVQRPSAGRNQWNNTDLDAALHRAIQSSPAGRSFVGTQESPIDLSAEELTPKPTRRVLFPSPRNSKDGHKALDDTALPGAKPPSTTIIETAFVEDPQLMTADKENMPPPHNGVLEMEDDLAHLFECSPGIFRTPGRARVSPSAKKTPRIGSGGFEDLLKTPTPNRSSLKTLSSNARQAFTPRTCSNNSNANTFLPTFSPAEKQNLGVAPLTPSRFANLSSPSRSGQMTPFTRQLNQLLAHGGDGHGASPGRGGGIASFDFADFGVFGNSPGRGLDFDKMEFSVEDFEGMDFGGGIGEGEHVQVHAQVKQGEGLGQGSGQGSGQGLEQGREQEQGQEQIQSQFVATTVEAEVTTAL